MRTLAWFRRDLRTADQRALHAACAAADDGVVAVFVVTPEQWRDHDEAPCKVGFWLDHLRALSHSLRDLNIPLRIVECPTFDDLPDKLLSLAVECGCDALYYNREYEINEAARDEAVTRSFEKEGLAVHAFDDRVVVPPGEVSTGDGSFYRVYTPYSKSWIEAAKRLDRDVLPAPKKQRKIDVKPSSVPEAVRGYDDLSYDSAAFPPGEAAAAERLAAFVDEGIRDYHDRRDIPDGVTTSRLSPYLAAGSISPRQCLAAALDANHGRFTGGAKGPRTWINELIWREFYTHILVGFPRVCMHRPFQAYTSRVPWQDDESLFDAWCRGMTGYPIVDAAMRQLNALGWMHNRLRMVAAMFLSKHLLLDWRLGERYFMNRLIDGDLAANNGGWQWSASTGTDAAPYFRIFNPYSQGRRFDPEGNFIVRYCPELAGLGDDVHCPPDPESLGYVRPIVDQKEGRERAIEAFKAAKG